MRSTSMIAATTLGFTCLVLIGCGRGAPGKVVVYGSVTYGGEKAPIGMVSFVPIEGTAGPACGAPIVDGQYRIESRGGVAVGKYRVRVDARKKTGRKVQGFNGLERTMVDEEVPLGSPVYAGEQSPLVVDVRLDSDGRFDIAIPR